MTADTPPAAAASPTQPIVPLLVNSPPISPPAKRIKTDNTTASIMAQIAQEQGQPQALASAFAPTPATVIPVPPSPVLQIQKLSTDAKLPTRGSAFAAGYDLYAARDCVLPARGKGLVDTDIAMAVPAGTYGRIAPRSGLAAKHFIDTGAGVIDADYRGHVRVLLFNHGESEFAIAAGDRVAQLVLERIVTPDVVEVAELETSVRGAGGFGSTGGFGAAAAAAAAPSAADEPANPATATI